MRERPETGSRGCLHWDEKKLKGALEKGHAVYRLKGELNVNDKVLLFDVPGFSAPVYRRLTYRALSTTI